MFRELAAAYERYAAWIIRLAFLSPDITGRILDGTQPTDLTLHGLLGAKDIPLQWDLEHARIRA